MKNDEDLCLMAQAILDKSPQNPKDLHAAVHKYLVNGEKFNKKLKGACANVQKELAAAGCIGEKKKRAESPDCGDTPSTQFEDSESMNTPLN